MAEDVEPEEVKPGNVKLCRHCGIRPAGHGQFGRYCDDPECKAEVLAEQRAKRAENEPVSPKRPKSGGGGSAPRGNLEREINEACMGTAAVLAIGNQGIYVGVEAAVDEFAAAWANVARQSPTAERYIRMLLEGGVWITAAMATLTMVVSILVGTGKVPPALHPYGWMVVGRSESLTAWVMAQQQHAQAAAQEPEPAAQAA